MLTIRSLCLRNHVALLTVGLSLSLVGCANFPIDSNLPGNIGIGVAGAAALGARTPSQEIQQIYYLGVFDPQEQVPPLVYRVRVHGQASVLSNMKFGSGWVPANLVDSLSTNLNFKENGFIGVDKDASTTLAELQTGRRLVMFGPEGFREAPRNQRLVIVMGADPSAFFSAVDQSLGQIGAILENRRDAELQNMLFAALSELNLQQSRLLDLKSDVESDLTLPQGGNE